MPHTVLIEGEKGSGRGDFARKLAAAILCEKRLLCGTCRHCVKVEKDIHPDLEIRRGGARAHSFHVDAVREMRSDAYTRPNEADARVFLLFDAQTMSVQAQNALLKIVEEPPPGVHFILVCESRDQLLPTIRSRAALISMDATGTDDKSSDDSYVAAGEAFAALVKGDELTALTYLYETERDREAFIRRLGLFRAIAAGQLNQMPLQAMRIIDIIDDISKAAEGNGSIPVLTVSLCGRVRETMYN